MPRLPVHRLAASTLALALAACAGTPPPPLASPKLAPGERRLDYRHNIDLFKVSNGMLVALVPEDNTNLVKVDMRYLVGAAEDPAGKAGLAHVVEHMLFTVRKTDGGPTIADALGAASLGYNAYTNWDETHYTVTALADQLPRLLALERQRMSTTCAQIDEQTFARERQVVIQELLQRNVGSGDFGLPVRRFLFGNGHAYTRSVGGTTKSVMNITRDDVCKFIEAHYAPNRAILVVSGDINAAQLRPVIGGSFGPIRKVASGQRRKIASMTAADRTTITMDVEESAVIIAFPAPKWGSAASTKNAILISRLSSALRQAAREADWVGDVGATRLGGFRGGATAFYVSTKNRGDLPKALKLYEKARKRAASTLTPARIDGLINGSHLEVLRSVEPFRSRATLVADYLQYTTDMGLMIGELRRIGSLTTDELTQLTRSRFRLTDAHIVEIVPDNSKSQRRKRLDIASDTKSFDLETWREPVDPASANNPLHVPDKAARVRVRRHQLDNGLEVILAPDLSHPVVDARLVFATGTDHDPPDKKGLSRLAGTLMGPDTKRLFSRHDVVQVNFIATRLGLGYDSEVGEQSTSFHVRGLNSNADAVLWQLYRWVHSGVYDKADLRAVHKRAASAKQSADARRSRRAVRAVLTGLYGAGHPYVPSASPSDPRNITLADLRRYQRDHYRLANAQLIVTGNFDEHAALRRIERLYGTMRGKGFAPPLPDIPAASPTASRKHYALVDADAAQPSVLLAFPTENGITKHRAERDVLAEMIRLRMSQVRKRFGASYGVQVTVSKRRGPGSLIIRASLDAKHGGKALAAMTTALDELRAGKNLAADFVRARRKVFRRMLATSVDSAGVASELEFVSTHGLAKDYFRTLAKQTATMKPEAVRDLIAAELPATRGIVLITGRAGAIKALYDAAGVTSYNTMK